jgi:hypothetical protein
VGGRASETTVVAAETEGSDEPGDAVHTDGVLDADDVHVRDVHAPDGFPVAERPAGTLIDQALLDEVADHDTVVLGHSTDDSDSDDPRARIPAWEDIVFGVRRHR